MKTQLHDPGRREFRSVGEALPWTVGAVGCFHLAFLYPPAWWLVLGYLGCLYELRRLQSPRQAFYIGLLVGLGVFVPATIFLWTIFSAAAIPLWCILAFFHAVWLLSLQQVDVRWGGRWAVVLSPILWCGIEYFRSEVWWLRFFWLTAGSLLGFPQAIWLRSLENLPSVPLLAQRRREKTASIGEFSASSASPRDPPSETLWWVVS